MSSISQAMPSDGYAMAKTNAMIDAANRVLAFSDSAAEKVAYLFRSYAETRRRHRDMIETIALLSRLDDHQLRDIGVERGQIAEICRGTAE